MKTPAVRSLVWGACVILSQVVPAAAEEVSAKFRLQPNTKAGQIQTIEVQLEVGGDLRFSSNGKTVTKPLSVSAKLNYDEMILATDAARRAARYYDTAEATIKVERGGSVSKLRDDRRPIVAATVDEEIVLFSPAGPLNRDELDLIDVLGNTLVFDQLLPTEEVAIGESWPQSEATIKALLGLDAVAHCEVQSLLAKVDDQVAEVMMAGTVEGAAEGVATEVQLKARYHFDLRARQIVGMTLAVKEKREIGHIGPGLDVVAKLRLKATPRQSSEHLTAALLQDPAYKFQPAAARVEHESETGGFGFASDRRWFVTSDELSLVVLRLIDRGDLVAQCNISPVPSRSADKRISLAEYQAEVRQTLGDSFRKILSYGEWTDEAGHLIYRVTAEGQVEKLPIEWRYYLVQHPDGRRVALAFTVESELSRRLGDSDRQLLSTLRLRAAEEPTASKPVAPALSR